MKTKAQKLTSELEAYRQLTSKREPLLPELKKYLTKDGPLGQMLRHPLVYAMICTPETYALYNHSYRVKSKAVKEALDSGDFRQYIWYHERPYRLQAFCQSMHLMSPKQYWTMLHDIWVDSENIWQNLDLWKSLMLPNVPCSYFFMDEKDRAFLKALKTPVTIYRGCNATNQHGLSYTLDRDKAAWFSRRFQPIGARVIERVVMRAEIFAYSSSRGESEIILQPEAV